MSFANIFSKKRERQSKSKQIIQVDNREKNSLVPSELISAGFEIEWKQLPIADYLVNNVAIERKTVQDLKSSIVDKRIFSQLKELEQYHSKLLVIEGVDDLMYNQRLHENSLRGFLLSTALRNKIPTIYTRDEKDTAKFIQALANKKSKSTHSIRPKKIIRTEEEQLTFILEGFPNIGQSTAHKLLEKFKNIRNILNASEEELKECIGAKSESIIYFRTLTSNF